MAERSRSYGSDRPANSPASRVAVRIRRSILCVALLSCLGACAGPQRPTPTLVVAVDGFEWNVVLDLFGRDQLPTLQRLIRHGRSGLLASMIPTNSPIIWTTVATGRPASEHKIDGFAHLDDDGEKTVYDNPDRRTKAYWNILSDFEVRSTVIGWWLTYPVEPIEGVMVAQSNSESLKRRMVKGDFIQGQRGQVHPPELAGEIEAIHRRYLGRLNDLLAEIFPTVPARSPFRRIQWLLDNSRWSLRADLFYQRVALWLSQEGPQADLTTVYFGGADVLAHRFWRFYQPWKYDPTPSDELVAQYGEVLTGYYRQIDRMIGELIATMPEESNVVVISDHGMYSNNHDAQKLGSADHFGAPPGVFIAAGPDFVADEPAEIPSERGQLVEVASVFDITPILLTLMRVPIGEDLQGRVPEGLLAPGLEPTYVRTHETEEWAAQRRRLRSAWGGADDSKRLEQLRALGYIE